MKNKRIVSLLIAVAISVISCKEETKIETSEDNKTKEMLENQPSHENVLIDFEEISSATKKELSEEYWLGVITLRRIIEKKDGLILELHNEFYAKLLMITDKFLIVSYAVDASEERTLIYNKASKKHYIINDFATDLINSFTIKVERDYYDSLDVDDPNYQGHIFEEGTYNLDTGKYKKSKNGKQ
jgi:hypothetical protein